MRNQVSFWGIFPAPFFRNHIDHTHLRLWEMQVLFPHIIRAAQTYRSVIFVRNPYRRFLSAIDEHFKKFQPSVQLATMSHADQITAIEAFIEKILNIGVITTNFRFIHFSPQVWFIRLGDRNIPTCSSADGRSGRIHRPRLRVPGSGAAIREAGKSVSASISRT